MVNASQGQNIEYLQPEARSHAALIVGVQHVGFGQTYRNPNGSFKNPNDRTPQLLVVFQLDELQPDYRTNGDQNPDARKPFFLLRTLSVTQNLAPGNLPGNYMQLVEAAFGQPAYKKVGEEIVANKNYTENFDESKLIGKQVNVFVEVPVATGKAKITKVSKQDRPYAFRYFDFPENISKFIETATQNGCQVKEFFDEESGETFYSGQFYQISPAHFGAQTHGQNMQHPPQQNPAQQNNNGGYQQQQPNEYPDNNFGNSPIDAPNDDYAPF